MSERAAEQSPNQDDMGPEQTQDHIESQKQPWVTQLLDTNLYAGYKAELLAEERRAYYAELPGEDNRTCQAELPAEESWVYQAELSANQNIMPGGDSDGAGVEGPSPQASPIQTGSQHIRQTCPIRADCLRLLPAKYRSLHRSRASGLGTRTSRIRTPDT